MAATQQQTQSLPAFTKSFGAASVASSEEETDCESDRGSGTPLRDHQSRLEAYMARKGMKPSGAFRQRVARLQHLSPCVVHARLPLSMDPHQQRATTSPMVIPARTNAFKGWEDDDESDAAACRCDSECAFEQLTEEEEAELEGLDDLMFDMEI